jgi:hypothetical protein
MFLKVQKVRHKSGAERICVSIVRSRRSPVTGRKVNEFVAHVGTFPPGITPMYGRFGIRPAVNRACDKVMLTPTERAQVTASMERMLQRH